MLGAVVLLLLGSVALAAQQPDKQAAVVGAGLFRSYCASCHGASAQGDGSVAEFLKVKPANLTEIADRNNGEFPFDKVRDIIDGRVKVKGHGHGEMPVWGDAFQVAAGGASDEQVDQKILNLTQFLWTLQDE